MKRPKKYQRAIAEAVSELDKDRAKELCDQLIAGLPEREHPFPVKRAKRILFSLRRKCYFDLMIQLADALISSGQGHAQVRRQYGQALIDSGQLNAALAVLAEIADDPASPPGEVAEARGLMGRAHKQYYVNHTNTTPARKQGTLEAAVNSYKQVYDSDPDGYLWHGINVVALLARAERDEVAVSTDEDYRDIARRISKTIEEKANNKKGKVEPWDYATAMEAAVALGDIKSAVRWAKGYVETRPDAFELASTLRQLEEVWSVPEQDEVVQEIAPLLNAALLEAEGGSVEFPISDFPELKRNADDMRYELRYGPDSYMRVEWFRLALDRCQAIGRVNTRSGKPVGTGFVVKGKSLSPHLEDDWYFLTNSHVITNDEAVISSWPWDSKPLRPEQARIKFTLLSDRKRTRFRVADIIFTSPPTKLDATLLRLKEPFCEVDVKAYQITPDLPKPEEQKRLYIAGHPLGEDLSVSLHDNHLLEYNAKRMRYRTPTDPGSSGSPVFNDEWELVGLHHFGSRKMKSLEDPKSEHEANEGIRISAIIKAIQKTH